MNNQRNYLRIVLVLVLIMLAFFSFWPLVKSCWQEPSVSIRSGFNQKVRKPDTITVRNTPPAAKLKVLVQPEKRYYPKRVTNFHPTDTQLTKANKIERQRIVQDTVISALQFKADKLEVLTIDTAGVYQLKEFELPCEPMAGLELKLDARGNMEVVVDEKAIRKEQRRKRWRRIGNYCLIGGAFVLGICIAGV